MTSPVATIARWEFLRFAKARDLVIGALIFAAMFGGSSLFGEFAGRQLTEARRIAFVGDVATITADSTRIGRFDLLRAEAADLDSLLSVEAVDAALVEVDDDVWEIRAERERGWFDQLQSNVSVLIAQERMLELELTPDQLTRLSTPAEFRAVVVDTQQRDDGRTDAFTAAIATGLLLMGLFVGFSFVFVAITGEKTQRVTESMLSAITPQQWIDGKLVGLTGAVMANLLSTALGYLLWQVLSATFFDGSMALPAGAAPLDVVGLAVFALLGFFFWFTLFAMVAATIDDPNSSSRSSMMFLPFGLMMPAFLGLEVPDAPWMVALSIVPGTSAAAMPIRLLRGDPAWFEIAISIALIGGAAWAFRRAAGKIFGTSMLMTGKEPGLREVVRWLREA